MKSIKVVLMLALVALSAPLFAAVPTQIDLDRAVVEATKKAIINRAMNLTPVNASAFWDLYTQYQAARQPIDDKLFALIKDYAKRYTTMNDSDALDLLNRMMEVQNDKLKLKADYIKKFAAALPGAVVARFFQADNKLDSFITADLAAQIPLIPTENLQALRQNAPSLLTLPKQ